MKRSVWLSRAVLGVTRLLGGCNCAGGNWTDDVKSPRDWRWVPKRAADSALADIHVHGFWANERPFSGTCMTLYSSSSRGWILATSSREKKGAGGHRREPK